MRSLSLLLLALLLVGCNQRTAEVHVPTTRSAIDAMPTTTATSEPHMGDVSAPDTCADTASCAAEFMVDGVRYGFGCTAARADALRDHTAGSTVIAGVEREVRYFRDVDPSLLVAVKVPGGICYEGEHEPLSEWSLGFGLRPPGEDPRIALDAVCSVGILSEAQREASGCS
jgi:hypothetical protein